jgi:hypothetical protein
MESNPETLVARLALRCSALDHCDTLKGPQKAFDYDILLMKLKCMGLNDVAMNWFRFYLTNGTHVMLAMFCQKPKKYPVEYRRDPF